MQQLVVLLWLLPLLSRLLPLLHNGCNLLIGQILEHRGGSRILQAGLVCIGKHRITKVAIVLVLSNLSPLGTTVLLDIVQELQCVLIGPLLSPSALEYTVPALIQEIGVVLVVEVVTVDNLPRQIDSGLLTIGYGLPQYIILLRGHSPLLSRLAVTSALTTAIGRRCHRCRGCRGCDNG